ncbi:MAG: hypothetical protein IIU14_03130 [Ruminococcus sp.]|nr:hypothetical protein [Ruminococcus sp.]
MATVMNIKQEFETIKVPSAEELRAISKDEGLLFPEKIDDDFARLSYGYQYLFGRYLILQTGLDKLDKRIAENEILPCPGDKMEFYQKYDSTGLKYFYLRCSARIDRLSDSELERLKKALGSQDDEGWTEAMRLISSTMKKVMAVCPDKPDTVFILKNTYFSEYRAYGDSLPVVVKTYPEYDENGNLVSEEKEELRQSIILSLCESLADALSQDLGFRVSPIFPTI